MLFVISGSPVTKAYFKEIVDDRLFCFSSLQSNFECVWTAAKRRVILLQEEALVSWRYSMNSLSLVRKRCSKGGNITWNPVKPFFFDLFYFFFVPHELIRSIYLPQFNKRISFLRLSVGYTFRPLGRVIARPLDVFTHISAMLIGVTRYTSAAA